VIIDAFVVVVIGGMGSVLGALVASLLVGIVNAWGVLALPGWSVVLTFVCMAVVLIVRPWGLFGSQE
jgi:branched-chain amino acid transport system permease protein